MNLPLEPQKLTLLDVTLRDGGYRNHFHFPQDIARRLVRDLADSRIDYIEVGYRNGLAREVSPLGPQGHSSNAYLQDLRQHCPNAKIGVMLHPQNVTARDLHELRNLGVSLIRVCLTAPNMAESIATINACKAFGFTTTANIIKVSIRDLDEVLRTVEILDRSDADVIYIADSFGNLMPQHVVSYLQGMRSATGKTLGFHAHNNLTLALANTIAAIQQGAQFIDSSVCGMGFGTGNLATEVLAGYFHRAGAAHRVDVVKLFELAKFVSEQASNSHLPLSAVDIFWGLHNLSSHFKAPVMSVAQQANISVFELAGRVAAQEGIRPVESEIAALATPALALSEPL